jgi:hypothetical protein
MVVGCIGKYLMPNEIETIGIRIKELGDKSTQVLLFLTFALVVLATMRESATVDAARKVAMNLAMKWWGLALYPVLLGILPVKEFKQDSLLWFQIIRWSKFILLWIATLLIFAGTYWFVRGL